MSRGALGGLPAYAILKSSLISGSVIASEACFIALLNCVKSIVSLPGVEYCFIKDCKFTLVFPIDLANLRNLTSA